MRILTAIGVILGIAGCSTEQAMDSGGRVPFAAPLEPLIGEWASDGELALIFVRDGDDIVVRNPPNDTWRFEITDISTTTDNSVIFTQRHFVVDGSDHPFNGVPCKCSISIVAGDTDSLKFTLTSPQLPDGETGFYTTLK